MSRRKYMINTEQAEKALLECDRVFVYGSLKMKEWNHPILSYSTYLTDCNTEEKGYVLGDVGFPYAFPLHVVPEEYKHLLGHVSGEMYKVTDPVVMADLDLLEGYPTHYNRRVVRLDYGMTAWMYHQDDWSLASRCNACHYEKGTWTWRS